MSKSDSGKSKGALEVDRQQLCQGLKLLLKAKAFAGQTAQLTFADGRLKVAVLGASFQADATGTWAGEVLVDDQSLSRVARASLSQQAKLSVSTNGRELRIDTITVPCDWNAMQYPRISLPVDAKLIDVLRLPQKFSTTDIERSGLAKKLAAGERKRDELIRAVLSEIRVAESALGLKRGALGMDPDFLRARVDEALKMTEDA
jgi:hypothetical protein